jgi:cytochrome c-type biogenesis protein CcmE
VTPRRTRLAIAAGVLLALSAATALVLNAFRSNLVFFFTPSQVAAGEAPQQRPFRLGGLVRAGSLQRDGVDIRFVVTDTRREVPVAYRGLLPDLFKEGKGVVAQGMLGPDGVFVAREVLAKHDENYMPPEAAEALKRARRAQPLEERRAAPGSSPPSGGGVSRSETPGGPIPVPTLVEAKR